MNPNQGMSCPQDWNKMQTVTEQKRFCHDCQKCVHDFTKLSIPEIEEKIETLEEGFCCRMEKQQYKVLKQKRTYWGKTLRWGAAAAIFAGTLFLGNNIQAQDVQKEKNHKICFVEDDSEFVIRGKVIGKRSNRFYQTPKFWNRNKPVENATVTIKSSLGILIAKTETDENGVFEIKVNNKLIGQEYKIIVDAWDFDDAYIYNLPIKSVDIVFKLKGLEVFPSVGCPRF